MKYAIALFLLILIGGCNPSEDATTALPPEPVFAGQPDPSLAGVYQQEGADIRMTLSADGALTTKGTVNARGQVIDVDGKGRWAVDGKHLFMEVESAEGKKVNRRSYELKGEKLILTSDILPKPTVYSRVDEAERK